VRACVRACTYVYVYSYNERQCTISQIYLIKYSTRFRNVHCPSSAVSQHCIHATCICHASSVGFHHKKIIRIRICSFLAKCLEGKLK
jgi:hypothetical protein